MLQKKNNEKKVSHACRLQVVAVGHHPSLIVVEEHAVILPRWRLVHLQSKWKFFKLSSQKMSPCARWNLPPLPPSCQQGTEAGSKYKENMLCSPIQGRRMGRGKSPRWSSQRSRSNRQLGRIFLNGGGDNLGIVKHFVHHHFLPPNDRSMITINPQWWWSQSQFFISMCNYLISSPHSSAAGKR